MIIEEIRKANIKAMKEKDATARAIFSIVLNKCLLTKISLRLKEKENLKDEQVIQILQKTIKELTEEVANYTKANNAESAEGAARQKLILEQFLPELMSAEEIKAEIEKLADKKLPTIMKHFKKEFEGKVDMQLVNNIAREYN